MSKAYDPPRAVTSLSRAPMEKGEAAGVTIKEIEQWIDAATPPPNCVGRGAMMRGALLFAILRVGTSIQKLEAFTRYPRVFLFDQVEALRACGVAFTGSISTQYLLDKFPGSESLIERITGQRLTSPTRKEKPKLETLEMNDNCHAQAEPEIVTRLRSPETREKISKAMKARKGKGAKRGRKPRPALSEEAPSKAVDPVEQKGRSSFLPTLPAERQRELMRAYVEPATATAVAPMADESFLIRYKADGVMFHIEGVGRERLLMALEGAHTSLTGGRSNG